MKPFLFKKITFRVLIVEDTPVWYEDMSHYLKRWADKLNINVQVELAKDTYTATQLMRNRLFHAVAIDLRLPEKAGSPLASQAMGIELAINQIQTQPLFWGHLYTAYAQEFVLELYRKSADNKLLPPPIWEKASSDNEGPDKYTQKEWAQRIFAGILPRSAALEVTLVNQRSELKNKLENGFSCLGESMDFTVAAGRTHLPPTIAHSFSVMHRFLEKGDKSHELTAFQEALFLAESVQYWLWVQAAAWLTAMNKADKVVFPLQTNGKQPNRGGIEISLGKMCQSILKLKHPSSENWLSHLHLLSDSSELSIIDALLQVREMRNKHHHATMNEELPWEELAMPLRVILDACSFLASYPVLSHPKPAPDGRWRFTLLKGETSPLPEAEWILNAGVLGENQAFSPTRDEQTFYQLWPCTDDSLGLLRLWPFAEQQLSADNGRTAWLLAGFAKNNRFWEQSAIDGRNQCEQISKKRFNRLKDLGLLNRGHLGE